MSILPTSIFSLSRDLIHDLLIDSYDQSKQLLMIDDQKSKIYGLKRLARSNNSDSINLVLAIRREALTEPIRSTSEDILVQLSDKYPDKKGSIALSMMSFILHEESRSSIDLAKQSFSNVGKILVGAKLSNIEEEALFKNIEKWWRTQKEAFKVSSNSSFLRLLNPQDLSATKEWIIAARAHAENDVELALVLERVFGDRADSLRIELLSTLQPGPFSKLIFKSIMPHAVREPIRIKLLQLQEAWSKQYNNAIYSEDRANLDVCLKNTLLKRF